MAPHFPTVGSPEHQALPGAPLLTSCPIQGTVTLRPAAWRISTAAGCIISKSALFYEAGITVNVIAFEQGFH